MGTAAAFFAGVTAETRVVAPARGAALARFAQVSPQNRQFAFAGSAAPSDSVRSSDPGDDSASPETTFDSVYSLVKEHYVDDLPSDQKLGAGAVRTMLSSLNDPDAVFLEPDELAVFRGESQGRFGGIGAALAVRSFETSGYTERRIEIVAPLPDSPAARAGLRTHDSITHVDGKWVLGADPFLKVNRLVQQLQATDSDTDTLDVQRAANDARQRQRTGLGLFRAQMLLRGDETIARLYGLPRDHCRLTIERRGSPTPFEIDVPLAITEAPVVQMTRPNASTALLKIAAFSDRTPADTSAALRGFGSVPGVILDLRGNAGGVGGEQTALRAAEQVASQLAPTGAFAVEQVAGGKSITLTSTGDSAPFAGSPAGIVILVDSGTAGAAEALAASLADRAHATVVGQRTFGDARIRTLYPLPGGCAFTLTTGRLRGPRHTEWSGRGLTPSVALAANATDDQILSTVAALLHGKARIAAKPPAGATKPNQW